MGEGKNLIGVDIGSSSIKVCQVRQQRKSFDLVALGYAPLPPQVIVDGQIMDGNAVAETLQQIWDAARIRQREVSLSVSGQNAIIRKVTVPMMSAAELQEQIQWEAEQHIPFDIKDVQVDYQVLKRHPETSQMDLLLVAAKRDQINDYAQLARDAKLKPVVCDIDAFSIQNLFELARGLPQDQTIGLVNVGANLTSLNIIASGVSAFSREIANGGNLITEQIQKGLGIAQDQAEALKCSLGNGGPLPVPPEMIPIVESAADAIAAEIQRSVDFFMATSGESEISRIYLTGGTSRLSSLAQSVERRSRVPVEVWAPTERLAIDGKRIDPALLAACSSQLAVALGLSLRKEKEQRL
jgi:type IV pilus assembly protein PilM